MRLLDRYLFRELLAPLAYCLGGFLVFWISWDLFNELQEMQERKLHLLDVLEYSAAMTPEFLATILPIVLLLALLYALTGHTRHNEITAMRAAGASLWRICVPYFITGLVSCAVLFALNESLVPRAAEWAWRIKTRHVPGEAAGQNQFYGFVNAPEHRLWKFDEYRVRTAEMVNPTVSQTLPDGTLRELRASRAAFTNGVWTFFNVSEKEIARTDARLILSLQTNVLAMPEFKETPHQIEVEMKISAYEGIGKHKADISIADILSLFAVQAGQRVARRFGLAAHGVELAAGGAVDVPGGGAHRHSIWSGVRPAEPVHGRCGQHFHLLRLFSDSKNQLRFWRGRPSAGLAGGVAAESGFRLTGLWLIGRVK